MGQLAHWPMSTMTQFIWSVFVTTMGRNATDEVRCFAASAVNTIRSRIFVFDATRQIDEGIAGCDVA